MIFAKINVKKDYEEKGDLVFRPLLRVYEKLKTAYSTHDNVVPLIGVIYNGEFYELTTWKKIEKANYEIIDFEEFETIINNLKLENLKLLRELINFSVFHEPSKIDYGISSIEDLAKDRWVDFEGYNNELTNVNPYQEPLDGYSDFIYKCKMKKQMEDNNHGRKI